MSILLSESNLPQVHEKAVNVRMAIFSVCTIESPFVIRSTTFGFISRLMCSKLHSNGSESFALLFITRARNLIRKGVGPTGRKKTPEVSELKLAEVGATLPDLQLDDGAIC